MSYCLVCGTTETKYTFDGRGKWVNCYLDYGTAETLDLARSCEGPVNYCLDYGIYETEQAFYQRIQRVNYCLGYGNSETLKGPKPPS